MTYSRHFYERTSRAAQRSADRVVPVLAAALHPTGVLEVGGGGGAWLNAWSAAGIADLCALDIALPQASGYALPTNTFRQHDLTQPFDLGRRFSLVQSLEVAEHLPEWSAGRFIDGLCRHGDIVLFSAAPPGQGGVHHINEQPFAYWRRRFADRGYRPVDWLRHVLRGEGDVAWWYRYNMLIYANGAGMAALPGHMGAATVPDDVPIEDIAPLAHRMRRRVLRALPAGLVTQLARVVNGPLRDQRRDVAD